MARAVALGVADAVIVTTQAGGVQHIKGITVDETAGAAACVKIRENSGSGTILVTVRLLANTSQTIWFDGKGLLCNGSVYEDSITGAYAGSVFVE